MKPELHLPHPFCCAQVLLPGAMSLQELLEEDEEAGDAGGPSYAETCKQGQHLSDLKHALLDFTALHQCTEKCCTEVLHSSYCYSSDLSELAFQSLKLQGCLRCSCSTFTCKSWMQATPLP